MGASIERARSAVIEQACETVAAGPGYSQGMRDAVIQYYRACGDDEIADRLEREDDQ